MISKLKKLFSTKTNRKYETTLKDCLKWERIINNELFDGILPPITSYDIRWRRDVWAHYHGNTGTQTYQILLNKKYISKKRFVEILAHELVHHHQLVVHGTSGHGKTFTEWTEKFREKGLNLVKSYDSKEEEDQETRL